jgi:AcrR family transcriptional regulator
LPPRGSKNSILVMKNSILTSGHAGPVPVRELSVARSLARRETELDTEFQSFVDATHAVIARSGDAEPKVSDIVAEAASSNAAFYRHFESKDELMLAVLDDGQRHLVRFLQSLMVTAENPLDEIRLWIEGMLAQAAEPDAVERSRPFAVSGGRLAIRYPDGYNRCVQGLTALIETSILAAVDSGQLDPEAGHFGADHVYTLTMGAMQRHLLSGTAATADESMALVTFALAGLGAR